MRRARPSGSDGVGQGVVGQRPAITEAGARLAPAALRARALAGGSSHVAPGARAHTRARRERAAIACSTGVVIVVQDAPLA